MLNSPIVSHDWIDSRTVRLVVICRPSDRDTADAVTAAIIHKEGAAVSAGSYLRGMAEALSDNGVGAYILRKQGLLRNWDFNGIQAKADIRLPSWIQ